MAGNVYATIADLERIGIARDALGEVDPDDKNGWLEAASRRIDQSLNAQCTLPLRMIPGATDWGTDLIVMTVQLAQYQLLASRGFNPENEVDRNIRMIYEDAVKLLNQWASDDGAWPAVLDSSVNAQEQTPSSAAPSISSAPSRGWSSAGSGCGPCTPRIPFGGGR